MDMDYGSAARKASEYRRKARAWERAASALNKANRALAKAQEIEADNGAGNGETSVRMVAYF